jgi:hypothetical protein
MPHDGQSPSTSSSKYFNLVSYTSRWVAGSISDEVIEFFNLPYLSNSNMALGSIQPLTEMGTRNLPGGSKGRPARKADNLTATCVSTAWKIWEPGRLTTLQAFMAYYGDSFTFYAI